MNEWTNEELASIASADELQLKSFRQDGTLRNPVTIWVVRVGNNLYVRSVGGPAGKWFGHATERHQGRIEAGGVAKDVAFQEISDEQANSEVDAAYQAKYSKYGASFVGSTLTPQARAATLRIVPLE